MIKQGQLLLFTSGEYSNYQVHDLYRATRDFDMGEAIREHIKANPSQIEAYESNFDAVLAFLQVEKKYIESIEYQEVYLGSYSSLEKSLYCLHENRKTHGVFGHPGKYTVMDQCPDCDEQWPETERPATAEEINRFQG